MNPIQNIIWIVILIGLIVIPLVPPLLVLRGQRFWAPWIMVGAVVFFGLTVGSYIGLQIYWGKQRQALVKLGGSFHESSEWDRVVELMLLSNFVCCGLMVLCFLVYAVGLLGVATRWKDVSRRAKELEERTAELAVRRDTAGDC